MIVDKFLADFGLLSLDLTNEVKDLVRAKAIAFFRAGLTLSWADVREMDEETLKLFSEARAVAKQEEYESQAVVLLDYLTEVLNKVPEVATELKK